MSTAIRDEPVQRTTIAVDLDALAGFIARLARATGMNDANAGVFADVYMRSTLRGVGHHDVADLPSRIAAFHGATINPDPDFQRVAGAQAIEAWDGDNGPGELCSSHIVARAEALADVHGIAFCTIRNSNHFLSAAPYVQLSAERGYLALVFSRTRLVMGVAGHAQRILGNQPIGFAAASDRPYPLLLDICLAYASFGNLEDLQHAGQQVPDYWGSDAAGAPTTDPAAIMNGGTSHPIGGHKGFGLALLVETLTGVLSGGAVVDEPSARFEGRGVHAQAAIVIKPDALLAPADYRARVTTMQDRIEARAPGIKFPGQRSHAQRERFEREGSVPVAADVVAELNVWAARLGVPAL